MTATNEFGAVVPPKYPLPGTFNRLAIVGQAPGEREVELGEPFVGASGRELTTMMHAAGLKREETFFTNVFNFKLPGNQLSGITMKKEALPADYPKHIPAIGKGEYVMPEYLTHLDRLREELISINPNCIVALGNEALWALCGMVGMTAVRGTVLPSTLVAGAKVIPTYHPAAVLRNWAWRPLVIHDLLKAKNESSTPAIRRPKRYIWTEPALEDLDDFYNKHIAPQDWSDPISVDIETARPDGVPQITSIAFAPTTSDALVLPFADKSKPNYSYWETLEEELSLGRWCQDVLEGPRHKLFQNGLYEIQWPWRVFGIRTKNALHDTQIAHHAMYPELAKRLDFMGTLHQRGRLEETQARPKRGEA